MRCPRLHQNKRRLVSFENISRLRWKPLLWSHRSQNQIMCWHFMPAVSTWTWKEINVFRKTHAKKVSWTLCKLLMFVSSDILMRHMTTICHTGVPFKHKLFVEKGRSFFRGYTPDIIVIKTMSNAGVHMIVKAVCGPETACRASASEPKKDQPAVCSNSGYTSAKRVTPGK